MAFYPGVERGCAEVGGDSVIYFDSGVREGGETIVLLPGTGGYAKSVFWALFPMLAYRHRVVTLDFVDPADPENEGDQYREQILAVVRKVSADSPVHVVGYSFGATVAVAFAAEHADRVASLTLIAGWLRTDAQQRLRNKLWFRLRDSNPDALAEFTTFTAHSAQFLNGLADAELNALISAYRDGADRSAKMAYNRGVDLSSDVEKLTAPTLVIACTHDQMVSLRQAQMFFGAIRDARLATVNAGHGVLRERPSELFSLIDNFVRDPQRHPAGSVVENAHA